MKLLSLTSNFSVVVLLTAAACVPQPYTPAPTVLPNESNPIRTVAILLFINNTNDVEAPTVLRNELFSRLNTYFYDIKPLSQTDQILKDQMGIALGSQLDLTTPQKLGATLGVDGLIFGVVENMEAKMTAALNEKRIRTRFTLVDAKTGNKIWGGGAGVISRIRAGGLVGAVGSIIEIGSTKQAAEEAAEEKARQVGRKGTKISLPGHLDKIGSPWIIMPTIQRQAVQTNQNVLADLMADAIVSTVSTIAEKVIEKSAGTEFKDQIEYLMNMVLKAPEKQNQLAGLARVATYYQARNIPQAQVEQLMKLSLLYSGYKYSLSLEPFPLGPVPSTVARPQNQSP